MICGNQQPSIRPPIVEAFFMPIIYRRLGTNYASTAKE
ncbi:hypothetical protein VP168E361_P0067 [Vibrio phage 168E36-1]|nr:hypothetical protein VP168E361_P0067 [Vibrio phage 168E36-1]